VSLLFFTAIFTFVLLALGRRGAATRGGARLREEIDALFSGEHEYRDVVPADFPYADVAFYDRVQKELEAIGFRRVGDVEDLTLSRVYPERRTFVRLLVDDAALIRVGAFHLRARGGLVGVFATIGVVPRDLHVVELVTELPRGRFLITAPTKGLDRLDPPPEVSVDRLPPGTSLKELVAHHKQRIADQLRKNPAQSPVEVRDRDSVMASVQRGHVVASEHRQKVGRLSKDELERMTGAPLGEQEEEMLKEVRRKQGEEAEKGEKDKPGQKKDPPPDRSS
jgi:hypothetical protein